MLNLARSSKKLAAVVSLLPRIGVGGYFMYAAYSKIVAPETFVSAINSYEMLDPNVVPFMAYTLPWLELFCGLLLALGVWACEARGMIVAMLLVFIYANASALVRGLEIDCGCTGAESSTSGWWVISRNAIFLGLLAIDLIAMRISRPARSAARAAPPAELPIS